MRARSLRRASAPGMVRWLHAGGDRLKTAGVLAGDFGAVLSAFGPLYAPTDPETRRLPRGEQRRTTRRDFVACRCLQRQATHPVLPAVWAGVRTACCETLRYRGAGRCLQHAADYYEAALESQEKASVWQRGRCR